LALRLVMLLLLLAGPVAAEGVGSWCVMNAEGFFFGWCCLQERVQKLRDSSITRLFPEGNELWWYEDALIL
jgi:hypothetical protein